MLELHQLIVALAEPSGMQAEFIRRSLAEFEIDHVTVLHNGMDMLDHLQASSTDLVISALYLPDMTGTELVYHMRDDMALREVPFMLISSETHPHRLDPIRQAGVCTILPKPFTQHQLDRALSNTLDFLTLEDKLQERNALDLSDLSVLLVDDSATARRHVRSVLNKIGINKITEAGDGREAVPIIDTTLFDLVFTDYNMPEMDGRELVEYIRTRSPQKSVPVLMVSSESNEGRLAAVEEAGVSAICDKPFEAGMIGELIRRILSS